MTECVLLAGGRSSRMGTDKLLLDQNGKTVLQRAVERFSGCFDCVSVSVREENQYPELPIPHIKDLYPGCGPLAGLHAALKSCRGDGVFVAAADLPFSSPELALRIQSLCTEEYDICVAAKPDGRTEPLFGFYRVQVLPTLEELLQTGQLRMSGLFQRHPTRILRPGEKEEIWDERAFANMNTPEEYQRLLGGRLDWGEQTHQR
ncbi:MAG: molybdenum cofactor guanylyltransferase [Oscillospiraceae bacterium]|nr:molybdenum cofactor guanylyltransferase [Oscillospiraceae bacterium]